MKIKIAKSKSKRPSAWRTRLAPSQQIALAAPLLICLLLLIIGVRNGSDWLVLSALALALPSCAWMIGGSLLIVRNRKKRFWR